MGTIAVKNVNETLYRRAKALASLRGETVGEAVNEALAMWLSQRTRPDLLDKWEELEKQTKVNNDAFNGIRQELMRKHSREYAVIMGGRLVGTYRTPDEAYRAAANREGAQTVVAHLVDEPPRVVELGWSLMEELAR
ncbi:MAG: hypothetical protein LYZ70_05085 [Nitrososphaerales archaeon]|nr:hypothetical protein [Nitrososphaerales archaeon]